MKIRNLSALGYAQGFTFWLYRAEGENLETVEAPGYFADAASLFRTGDLLVVVASNGTRLRVAAVSMAKVQLDALS